MSPVGTNSLIIIRNAPAGQRYYVHCPRSYAYQYGPQYCQYPPWCSKTAVGLSPTPFKSAVLSPG
eukprot:8022953-Pyramimonas_sp.AAC.1